jgi:site-specific recombinase XerD
MSDSIFIRPQRQHKKTTYQVEYYEVVDGVPKRRRENFKTKQDAINREQDLLLERARAEQTIMSPCTPGVFQIERKSIQDALSDFANNKYATAFDRRHHRKEMSNYNLFGEYIIEKRGRLFVDEITLKDIEQWRIDTQASGVKNATIERRTNSVRSFLNYCVNHKYRLDNPVDFVTKLPVITPKRELWASQNDKVKVCETIQAWASEMFVVLDETLARPIELCRQTVGDFDRANRTARYVSGKGNTIRERWIPLTDKAFNVYVAVIERRRAEGRGKSDNLIFRNSKGNAVSTEVLSKQIRIAREKLEIKESSKLYALRHEGLTNLGKNNVGLRKISELAGHSKAATTMHYMQVDVEDLRNVINIADKVKRSQVG